MRRDEIELVDALRSTGRTALASLRTKAAR
jgi:hypothetical protein